MIGQTLAHYRIESKLGEGGMGVVYKAHDLHLERPVALKVLPPESVADPRRKQRFVQEAKAASALNHPNIIHIYDIDTAGGVDFIAMEFVPGKTLDQVIGRRGLPLRDLLQYAIQIADALARAHSAGIIHRDLKPANVMAGENGHVKVLDFGLAKLAERPDAPEGATVTLDHAAHTEEGTIVGTVAYMSPEQAEGKKIDARGDIFSFGGMLYEMATGRRPFQGDTKLSILTAIVRDDPKPISEGAEAIPSELERIIHRCLRKDPARRFQHMEDLKVALEELKEESESGITVAVRPGLSAVKASKRWILAAVVSAVLLIAAAGWWFLRRSGSVTAGPLRIVPLTSFAGQEFEPALSPDGNQVAFVWAGEKQDNFDIYVKLIDGGAPLRLTSDPAPEVLPTWAPDGRRLAFLRAPRDKASSVYVIPALGGPERKIIDLLDVPSKLSWSPDGRFMALDDRGASGETPGIFLISVETGEKRRLTSTPKAYQRDAWPAFGPDSRTLAFARGQSIFTSGLYLLAITADGAPAGEPRRITAGNWLLSGVDWMPDGRSLVFSASPGAGANRLWRVPVQGGPSAPERIPVEAEAVYGPSVSRQGSAGVRRLAYVQYSSVANIWRLPGAAAPGKRERGRVASPVRLIASSQSETAPQVSLDAKRVAFISGRSGSSEVWASASDGSRPVQLTSFGGPHVGSPRWAPDSQRIAFDAYLEGQADIYIVSADGGAPRRLTFEKSNEFRPSWSHDGRWIYFGSNRTGLDQIWKMPAQGGAAVQITKNGGHEAFESADGKFIYYAKRYGSGEQLGIFRVAAGGGDEAQVLDQGQVGSWALSPTGIYLLNSGVPSITFYSFATARTTEVARFSPQTRLGLGGTKIAASPDDQWIVYVQVDRAEADIMMVENFPDRPR